MNPTFGRMASLLVLLLPACAAPRPSGLGELMTLTQMRHAKLWYAGEAHNWPLAAYELDELHEGFDDVVAFHGDQPGLPLPPAGLVPVMMDPPLASLRSAIDHQDVAAFEQSFDALTAGCNNCHQASDHGFNVVRRPQPGWFGNQDFAPAR